MFSPDDHSDSPSKTVSLLHLTTSVSWAGRDLNPQSLLRQQISVILVSLDYVITLHFCLGTPYIVCTHLWSFLQFSSALICFILRGANFHRISGVFQFAFLQKAALPRVNQFLVNSLSRYQLRFTYPFNLFFISLPCPFFLDLYPVLPRNHPFSIYFIELFVGPSRFERLPSDFQSDEHTNYTTVPI